MSKPTCVSLFAGGGGKTLGAMAAGYEPVLGVEMVPEIAHWYERNIGKVAVAPIADVEPAPYSGIDLLMASPPCQAHSVARSSALPDREDADAGLDIIRWVRACKPRALLIENVMGYRKAESFHAIVDALYGMGYFVSVDVLNAADFGVPQTRKRMILRAVYGEFPPPLPSPVPWVGWYAAIEDILHTLPPSEFAPWQLKRLPDALKGHLLVDCKASTPSKTYDRGPSDHVGRMNMRPGDDPCFTVLSYTTAPRAWISPSSLDAEFRAEEEPAHTVCANVMSKGAAPRAYLVDGANSRADGRVTRRDTAEPCMTVTSGSYKGAPRAWLEHGRVVSMAPRALARFQSFPDSYELPENKRLAGTIIGNAVPPLMAQRLCEGLAAACRQGAAA